MRLIQFLLLFFFCADSFSQQSCFFELGDSLISIVHENQESESDILFINVHENEATSINALRFFDLGICYEFVWLQHNATRRIYFNHKEEVFSVDPNRIFSHEGIVETLAYDKIPGCFSSPNRKAERMAKSLAHEILKYVHNAKWVISLHNNTPDNYSIKSYLPGGDEALNTKEVFINDQMDADDFIYTTDEQLFLALKKKNINVILQDNVNCVNDGSLSVYCGMKGIPYANVEAEDGHVEEQMRLIAEVVESIEELALGK